MKRQKLMFLGIAACLFVLTGCGAKSNIAVEQAPAKAITAEADAEEQTNSYITLEAEQDGNVLLNTDEITDVATFANYDADGTTVQLLAVRDADDTVRIAFNTCQSCSPAPQAYFVQEEDSFVCQNCGNMFTTDQIGEERGGCNPMPVEEQTETEDGIAIPTDYLEEYADAFSRWEGPTE